MAQPATRTQLPVETVADPQPTPASPTPTSDAALPAATVA